MVCLLTTVVVCLLVTVGCVTCLDDFDFTCPDSWKNGTVHTLVCIIPSNKLNSPTPCDAYIDTVEFRIIKGSIDTLACAVTNINTACNNNNINEDTCGCQSNNGTDITIVYKIKAVRSEHENAKWACRPQCYDANGNIAIQARNTSACFQTRFEQITTTTSPSTSANPCLGHTCRSKPGCPCDCSYCWYGTECTDFCLLCLLYILLVAVIFIIIGCLCHYCGNDEISCCCCWIGCCCCAIALFCCKPVATTGGTDEEVQCKCVYRNRQNSVKGKSEPLNSTDNAELRDIDRKLPGGQQAPEAPSDPSSNSGVTRSSKMNQEKLETQEKEEEHSNKSSIPRPMVYPSNSIAPGKEQREKNHSLPGANIVGIQSTGFTTIPPLPSVNRNSYTKKTDPLPPISKQSNK